MRLLRSVLLAAVGLLGVASSSRADTITFTGSSGSLAASATFTVTGNTLSLTLTNTSTTGVSVPADVLTGVFFSNNSVALDATAATVSAGSLKLLSGSTLYTNNTTNVGAEWAAKSGLNTGFNPSGAGSYQGVAAAGYGLFGAADTIDPNGPLFSSFSPAGISGTPPDGLAGGLISSVGFASNANNGVKDRWLVKNSATFTFTFSGTLTAADIGNVLFQYGTATSEPRFGGTAKPPVNNPVPAPPAMLLAAIGIGSCMFGSIRRRLAKM